MDNPSNNELSSSLSKPLRLRVIPPKSRKCEDEVSPTCQKGNAVVDEKYSMPLIEEAIEEDSPMSEGTEAKGSERPRPTCDVCHKSFDSVKAVQGHMRMHPKVPAKKKRVIDERKYPLNSSKKVKLSESGGTVENREMKRKNHHEVLQSKDAMRVSNNIMFLDTRMGQEYTTNQNWSTNLDDLGGKEAVNAALILLHITYGMDWEEYIPQNLHTYTKRSKTEGNVPSSSNAEIVLGSDTGTANWFRNNQRRSTGSTQIPGSSVQNPIEAESSTEKERSNDINLYTGNLSAQIHIENESSNERERPVQIIPYEENSSSQVPNSSIQIPVEHERSIETIPFTGHPSAQIPIEYKSCNQKEKGKAIMIESSNGKGNHVCSVCDKSFSSHQALGGHMTSHRENKLKLGGDGRVHKKNEEREHVCKTCGEVYETGQKLGGHMRKHYNKNEGSRHIGESPSVNAKEEGKNTPVNDKEESKDTEGDVGSSKHIGESSSVNAKEEGKVAEVDVGDGGIEQAPVRVVRGFDLNVAAVPTEEDGDQALVI